MDNIAEKIFIEEHELICEEDVEAYSYDSEDNYSDAASEISDDQLRFFLREALPPQEFIDGPPQRLPCGHTCQDCCKNTGIN